LHQRRLFPSRATQQFADGFGTDTHEPGDLAVGVARSSKLLDPFYAAGRQTGPTARVPPFPPQGCQTTFIETSLLPPDGASGVTENPGYIGLIGPPLFN
jgi:hypothetical protein